MTSKEAIENIKRTMIIRRHGNIDVGNKYNREILTIEKDLEVLEILKKYSYLVKKYRYSIDKDTIQTSLYCMNLDELEKVKEWLEK